MPANFEIVAATAPRFAGEFALQPSAGMALTGYEAELQRLCREWMALFAGIALNGDGLDALRVQARSDTLRDLRIILQSCIDDALDPDTAVAWCTTGSGKLCGRFELRLERLAQLPFQVRLLDAGDAEVSGDAAALADDIQIGVRDVPISDAQQALKIDIDRTITVLRVAVPGGVAPERRHHGGASLWDRVCVFLFAYPVRVPFWPSGGTPPAEDDARRRSRYIRRVAGIARVGLESTQASVVALASKSLDAFKEEFVAQEAGKVKNRYLQRLGKYALICAAISIVIYLAIALGNDPKPGGDRGHLSGVFFEMRNFPLLIAGTAIGTWLSFSLRRVILQFLDLAVLEEDRLDPYMRVIFVACLSSVVGLLLWTKSITVGLGEFQPRVFDHGLWALLLGLLLGIAERTVATAVYKRATDFGGAVGGK